MALVVLAGSGWTARALAEARPVLCLVVWDPVEGLDPDTLAVSFLIEREKSGPALDWEVRSHPDECTGRGPPMPQDAEDPAFVTRTRPSGVLVVAGTLVVAEVPHGPAVRFDVTDLDAPDRGQDVARRVLAFFRQTWAVGDLSLVEPGFSPPFRTVPVSRGQRFLLSVAGTYEYQPGPGVHMGGPGVVAGWLLAGERLVLGLQVAWLVPRDIREAGPTLRLQAVPVSLRLHGGIASGRFLLRLIGGGGIEWRRAVFGPPIAEGSRVQSLSVPVVTGGIEGVFRWTRTLRLAVGVEARAFLGGRGYAYRGATLFEAPRHGLGLTIGVGWVFPPAGAE